jgi:hypothetical protein
MINIQHIQADGTIAKLQISEAEQLEKLQELVNGYIEVISITPTQYMVVNEEGIILSLPLNLLASELAGFSIYGSVVIIDKKDFN